MRILLQALTVSVLAWTSTSSDDPNWYSPWPFAMFTVRFLGVPNFIAAILAGALFFFRIRWESKGIKSSGVGLDVTLLLVLDSILTLESFRWWEYGVYYQGVHYVVLAITINIIFFALSWTAWWKARDPGNSTARITTIYVASIWTVWYAAPLIGES